jgi:signal transduction histidine kinase
MIDLRFEYRSGRLIALSRTILACAFLLALVLDSGAWTSSALVLRILVISYLLIALAGMALVWNDWWLECRLGLVVHLIDAAFYAVLTFLTGGYVSPFYGFFMFLVVSAAMRLRTGHALATSLFVGFVFVASASLNALGGPLSEEELTWFIIRGTTIFVISTMVLWLGTSRFGLRRRIGDRLLGGVASADPPAPEALLFAAEALEARRAVFAWGETDEPWANVLTLRDGRIEDSRIAADAYPQLFDRVPSPEPFLFQLDRQRMLLKDGPRLRAMHPREPLDPQFAHDHGLGEGLAIPLRSSKYEGLLVVADIAGLCSDFLPIASRIGEQISAAFERAALFGSSEEATAARRRLLLARNLHDGALQFLAGMALKLRALKTEEGGATPEQLEELERELVRQQSDVHTIIENLRRPATAFVPVDLCAHLEILAARLAGGWGIELAIDCPSLKIPMTHTFRYQLDQLLREATSNAVRHGGARKVRVTVSFEGSWLCLEIADDGYGFPFSGIVADERLWQERLGPRSLHERLRSMGGSLAIAALPSGSALSMRLPLEQEPK